MTEEQIRNTFQYHSPNPESIKVHEAIRELITETTVMITFTNPRIPRAILVYHSHATRPDDGQR